MRNETAKSLLKLRNQWVTQSSRAEANVSAWMTTVIYEKQILFSRFRPQTLSQPTGKRVSAGEYDFVDLSDPNRAVALEIKPAYYARKQLEEALRNQAFEYAVQDRNFKKGTVVASNGYEYCFAFVYCPSRAKALTPILNVQFRSLHSSENLVDFTKEALSPTQSEVDEGVASQFSAGLLLNNTRLHCQGSQTSVWLALLDSVRDLYGRSQRSNEQTGQCLDSLIRDLRKFGQIRNTKLGHAVLKCLRQPEHQKRLISNIELTYGSEFPGLLALKHGLQDLRAKLP